MTADRPTPTSGNPAEDTITRVNEWSGTAPRLGDVTHVHRDHDPRAWHWFTRGPLVAADGGSPGDDQRAGDERSAADRDRDVEDEQLRDVSHEPAHGDGASRVWHRGDETDDEDAGR